MVNKPKAIGTAGETAVVRYARLNGFDGAERLALHGTADEGDVTLCPGAMIEVKAGNAAETASDFQIAEWLIDTELERLHRRADVALLVLKRKGKGAASAGQWWAILPGWTYVLLVTGDEPGNRLTPARWYSSLYGFLPPVRTTLAEALTLLRHGGYGTPLEIAA